MIFDTEKYKVWTWKNPLVLHWILNPGLAFNELLLGQRIPKVTLIQKRSRVPSAEKTFIPCPHCNTLHSGSKWTPQNNTAFKNWFGLYCDNCGKTIPCVRNVTSLILLMLTFPVWYWFKDRWKEKWLEVQKEKFSRPMVFTQPDFKWWYAGLQYAVVMFVGMSLVNFLLLNEEFTWKRLAGNAITWLIGGLLFGLIMKKLSGNNSTRQRNKNTQSLT